MAYRPHGKATVDPENPRAFAICNRCGGLFNSYKLNWQYQWQGSKLQNKRLQVCEDCKDKPSIFLRQVILPPDPPAIIQPRTEPYTIDEAGSWVIPANTKVFTTPGDVFYLAPQGATSVIFYCIGPGDTAGFSGGGGGACAISPPIQISAGLAIYAHVAALGESSWARVLTNAPPTTSVDGCLAVSAIGRNGGLASSCIGATAYSGGKGGLVFYGDGAGGGAAGPTGVGAAGGHGGQTGTVGGGGGGGGANGGSPGLYIGSDLSHKEGGQGGNSALWQAGGVGGVLASLNGEPGVGGSGGGGGYAFGPDTGDGAAGGNGIEFNNLYGAGGGGGGAGYSAAGPQRIGGNGGLYGGGAGGGDIAAGVPGTGLVVMVFS